MKSVTKKIIIVFAVLTGLWLFVRVVRFLVPMLLVAIVLGFLWDWATKDRPKYDDYEEVE